MDRRFDVAIVGFGPSGAVAAALLGQAGLSVYVCDGATDVYDKPRAISLDHEVMRVFQQIGIADAVAPFVEPFTPSEYYGVDGQLIRRMTMIDEPYPLGHTPSMVFSQPSVERVLREYVASCAGVHTELGSSMVSFTQDAGSVTLLISDGSANRYSINADWMIACDGASSTTRSLLGIELEDLGFDEPWLVIDALVNDQGLAKLPATSVQYCEPQRPCSYLIGPGNHRRWEIALHAEEDPVEMASTDAAWRLLSRWISPNDAELWRQASYRFHALVARDWRRNRVFIAGDAAHQQPPFLGQGMCQGVRDVTNLCWKLAAVVRGEVSADAVEQLLDSYAVERRGHVRELTTRIKQVGAVICEHDVSAAKRRDAEMLKACDGVVTDTPRQDVMPSLTAGFLSNQHGSGRGTIFPQPQIVLGGDAVLLDEMTGAGWRLVTDGQLQIERSMLARFGAIPIVQLGGVGARGHGDVLAERDGVVASWMDRHRCHAALVRPDHYVFGTAVGDAEMQVLLAEWSQYTSRSAQGA